MHATKQKIMVTAAKLVLGLDGSALLTGSAFADGTHDCGCNTPSTPAPHNPGADHVSFIKGNGGSGGSGGPANSNCAVPIGAYAGVIGKGGPTLSATQPAAPVVTASINTTG
jgi:hypothetical protein